MVYYSVIGDAEQRKNGPQTAPAGVSEPHPDRGSAKRHHACTVQSGYKFTIYDDFLRQLQRSPRSFERLNEVAETDKERERRTGTGHAARSED